jgi:hypothetical protein
MLTQVRGYQVERFTERVEQDALLDILVQTDREHAWPTTAAQKQLRESWGGILSNQPFHGYNGTYLL